MFEVLILKTGALGDVVRTTALLPGLHRRHPDARVSWLTAPGAVDLVRLHPQVAQVIAFAARADAAAVTARRWDWVISLDDEQVLCELASSLSTARLSGAHLDDAGARVYTRDVAPWFDMGLLSVLGKARADELKVKNERSHPEILCSMLGLEFGKPRLEFEPRHAEFAQHFAQRTQLRARGPVIGVNTGAGGRWRSKMLSIERTIELVAQLDAALEGVVTFVLFGGADERERNARIAAELSKRVRLVDAGVDNALLEYAALVDLCDLMITSDSLGLHVALARNVRTVVFFAPTSAAEIELFGLGEKVVSTAPDYCSYKPDADTSTLTPERIAAAVLRQLALLSTART